MATRLTPIIAVQETDQDVVSTATYTDLSCETAALTNGVKYLVIYNCGGSADSNQRGGYARLSHGSTVLAEVGQELASGKNFGAGGITVVTGNGTDTLVWEGRGWTTTGTTTFQGLGIIAIPLDDLTLSTDYHETHSDSGTYDLTGLGSTWEQLESLTFTPDEAGDWLILWSMEGTQGDGATGTAVDHLSWRWDVDGTLYNAADHQLEWEDDEDVCAGACARVLNLSAASHTIKIEAAGATLPNNNARARRGRIFALRLGALDGTHATDASTVVERFSTADAFAASAYSIVQSIPQDLDLLAILSAPMSREQVGGNAKTRLKFSQGGDTLRQNHAGQLGSSNGQAGHWDCFLIAAPEFLTAGGSVTTLFESGTNSTGRAVNYNHEQNDLGTHAAGQMIVIPLLLASTDIELTPGSVEASVEIPTPSVDLGTLSLTPGSVEASVEIPTPSLDLSLSLTPGTTETEVELPAPTLTLGPLSLTPGSVEASVELPSPALSFGPTSLTPGSVEASVELPTPSLGLSLSLTPGAVETSVELPAPSLGLALNLTPGTVETSVELPAPTLTLGTLSLVPGPTEASVEIPSPTLTLGTLSLTPGAVEVSVDLPAPALSFGTLSLTPGAVEVSVELPAPSFDLAGGIDFTPGAVEVSVELPAPTLVFGTLSLTPGAVGLEVELPSPVLGLGPLSFTPGPVEASIELPAPSLDLGPLSLTPGPVGMDVELPSPTLSMALDLTPGTVETEIELPAPFLRVGTRRVLIFS